MHYFQFKLNWLIYIVNQKIVIVIPLFPLKLYRYSSTEVAKTWICAYWPERSRISSNSGKGRRGKHFNSTCEPTQRWSFLCNFHSFSTCTFSWRNLIFLEAKRRDWRKKFNLGWRTSRSFSAFIDYVGQKVGPKTIC